MKKLSIIGVFLLLVLSTHQVHADNLPEGCKPTYNFSPLSGVPCKHIPCSVGDLYNSETGKKCDQSITNNNQTQTMESTNTPSSNTTQTTSPVITNVIANNATGILTVTTDVPTTVKVDYIDFNSPLLPYNNPNISTPNNWNTRLPMFLSVVADPSKYVSYTDTTLSTDHEIPYKALTLQSGHMYCNMVTVTDANGNTGVQTLQGDSGSGVKTYSWNVDNVLIAK